MEKCSMGNIDNKHIDNKTNRAHVSECKLGDLCHSHFINNDLFNGGFSSAVVRSVPVSDQILPGYYQISTQK